MRWPLHLALLFVGCRLSPEPPAARVRRAPGVEVPRTVLASPVGCLADDAEVTPCDAAYALAVAAITRMELEHAGFSIV